MSFKTTATVCGVHSVRYIVSNFCTPKFHCVPYFMGVHISMEIVWDEPKRLANLETHGLDFADARDRFAFEDAMIVPSYPGADGRPRFIALGLLDGSLVAI